jgi:hypothetical protein
MLHARSIKVEYTLRISVFSIITACFDEISITKYAMTGCIMIAATDPPTAEYSHHIMGGGGGWLEAAPIHRQENDTCHGVDVGKARYVPIVS